MRLRTLAIALSASLSLGLVAGCSDVGESEDSPLGDTIDDGKTDSLHSPTNHNDLFFGATATVHVGGIERYHAWQFSLSAAATVHLEAYATDWKSDSNTVLYVYRKGTGSTWNLVDSDKTHPAPTIDLAARRGTYRVVLKGRLRATDEDASVQATCAGDGCGLAADQCEFGAAGSSLAKLPDSYVAVEYATDGPPQGLDTIDPTSQEALQIKSAVEAAIGADTSDVADALGHIKAGTFSYAAAFDVTSANYNMFKFTTTDNAKIAAFFHSNGDDGDASAAAIFKGATTVGCWQHAPTCNFGASVDDIAVDNAQGDAHAFDKASDLDALQKQQVSFAGIYAPGSNGDAQTPGKTLGNAGPATFQQVTDGWTGAKYTKVTFRYQVRDADFSRVSGVIFLDGTTTPVAVIQTNRIERCAAYHEAVKFE